MRAVKQSTRGFSLLEIMVVVVIIGLLASVVTVGVMGYLRDARQTAAKQQMKEFEKALKFYKMDLGRYPTTGQGLKALLKTRKGGESYIDDIPKDPWGNDYRYRCRSSKYEITSYGANGREGGEGEDADVKVSSRKK